jgi:hypothetical protein
MALSRKTSREIVKPEMVSRVIANFTLLAGDE